MFPEHKGEAEFKDCAVEEEKPEIFLKFKFQTYEEFSQIQKQTGNVISCEVVPCVSASKYEFTSGRNCVSTFVEEIETFPVKEMEINNTVENEKGLSECVPEKGKQVLTFDEKIEFTEKSEVIHESIEKNSVISDSDSESATLRSVMNQIGDYDSDGFLSDGDFGGEFDLEEVEEESESSAFDENPHDFDEDGELMEELNTLQDHDDLNPDFLRDNDFKEDLGDDEGENGRSSNKLESLWEHQELIEQLKMELKKVKATGLPTILEESESPKITDDLKPWKIDEFKREDCIGELHKFYKSYRERMRKFDIMNYQKMYAMG